MSNFYQKSESNWVLLLVFAPPVIASFCSSDCTVAKAVWFRGLGLRVDGGHSECLMNWLANLQLQDSATGFDLCLMLIWSLWKHRNEILWNGTALPPLEIVLRSEGWMQEFHKWHKPGVRKANRGI